MSFKKWFEDADMPEKIDGVWVDLETGLHYLTEVRTNKTKALKHKDYSLSVKALIAKINRLLESQIISINRTDDILSKEILSNFVDETKVLLSVKQTKDVLLKIIDKNSEMSRVSNIRSKQ